jgi:hypothetical protein
LRPAAIALAVLVALLAAGCAARLRESGDVRTLCERGDYDTALKELEPLGNGGGRLLYLYERGKILRDQGRYADSNESLEEAHHLLEDLYTRSLSRELGALLTTDLLVEYRGERFEAGLVLYYKILNSLELGHAEDAAVEARRLNLALQTYRDRGGSFYTDDPFLQYVTGLTYGISGDATDAEVSLRAAQAAYAGRRDSLGVEPPPGLACDLAASEMRLGNDDDARRRSEEGGCAVGAGPGGRPGVVHLFLECGQAPVRVENVLELPIYQDEVKERPEESTLARTLVKRRGVAREDRELAYLLRVAMPALAATPSPVTSGEIRVVAGRDTLPTGHAVVVHNLGVLAARSFEEHQAEILLRAVTRSLAKYLAERGAEKKHGRFSGWLTNMLGVATENADTRTWSTLPDRILAARLELAPGTYSLDVGLHDAEGRLVQSSRLEPVEVRAGESRIVSVRAR